MSPSPTFHGSTVIVTSPSPQTHSLPPPSFSQRRNLTNPRTPMAVSLSTSPPAIFSTSSAKPHHQSHYLHLPFCSRKIHSVFIARTADNGADTTNSASAVEKNLEENEMVESLKTSASQDQVPGFKDPRWIVGTWDLKQFQMGGNTDWDAVIDAEARRRKWLEDNPEASSNDAPVIFDSSIIPWWAWIKRYHLPEAENLNAGRAAMIGFFMAYFVDSLTGIGIVHQTGNFYCKTLLFISVVILLIRNNEGIEKLKMLIEETTLYDKQWQATWKDDRLSQK